MLPGVLLAIFIFAFLVYASWFAFFTEHAIAYQKRLPFGLRRTIFIPGTTKISAIVGVVMSSFFLALLIHSLVTGAYKEP